MLFGDQAGFDGEIEVTHQFFHVVRQCCFQLAQCRRAHADQLALEAAFTHYTCFFITCNTDARHTHGDDRRHQQANPVAVGISLEHCADFRLAGEGGLQHADVVFERGLVDLDPGIAVLCTDAGDAVGHRQWRCSEGRVLQ